MIKFGYVAVVGQPNVGKSSLVNQIVGEKVSIVSFKPQTTRDNILGVKTTEQGQVVFIDTPGLHKSENKLDTYMSKNVRSATSGTNICLYLIDGKKRNVDGDITYLNSLKAKDENYKIIIAINKIDISSKTDVFSIISKLSSAGYTEIIPISAKAGTNVAELEKMIFDKLDEFEDKSCFAFEEDEYTDKSISFLLCEIVREKTLLNLGDEIPHGIAISLARFEEAENVTHLDIDIICEKDTHKGMIIGKGGQMLKKIGQMARIDMEKLLGGKIMLTLYVRVVKDWKRRDDFLSELGYKFTK